MLDLLQNCFKQPYQFSHLAGLMNHIGNIIAIVQLDFTKDKNAKNAAIDALCEVLKTYKEPDVVVPVETPTAPQG